MKYLILVPLGLILWGAILFPIIASLYGLIKWRGSWRWVSTVPLIVLAGFFAPIIFDWMHDASSHSLWGLVFIPLTMMLSAYSGVVVLLHKKKYPGELSR